MFARRCTLRTGESTPTRVSLPPSLPPSLCPRLFPAPSHPLPSPPLVSLPPSGYKVVEKQLPSLRRAEQPIILYEFER